MMIEKEEIHPHDLCRIMGLVVLYLDNHGTDGRDRLTDFLKDDRLLWDTSDVCDRTGWKRTHVQRLVSEGKIPYIPGKPNKFIPKSVKTALEELEHNNYSRRKTTRRMKK